MCQPPRVHHQQIVIASPSLAPECIVGRTGDDLVGVRPVGHNVYLCGRNTFAQEVVAEPFGYDDDSFGPAVDPTFHAPEKRHGRRIRQVVESHGDVGIDVLHVDHQPCAGRLRDRACRNAQRQWGQDGIDYIDLAAPSHVAGCRGEAEGAEGGEPGPKRFGGCRVREGSDNLNTIDHLATAKPVAISVEKLAPRVTWKRCHYC